MWYSRQTVYTIKQAAARSGVTIPLLRAWERRYGIVSPRRTSAGYRLYDDEAIARLSAMRRLVDAGWPASRAAEVIASGTRVEAAATPQAADLVRTAEPTAIYGVDAAEDANMLVQAATACDVAAIERALDALFDRGSFESVIDGRILPAVAALGTAWADGRLDVAGEHLASAAVVRRLSSLFDHAGAAGSGVVVLVGLPPGSRHEIGALATAVALRRRGMDVLYLGPDVPAASWVHTALESSARAAVLGVATPADVRAAREVARALRDARPELLVALGGPGADAATRADPGAGERTRRQMPGLVLLPDGVVDAAARIAASMVDG